MRRFYSIFILLLFAISSQSQITIWLGGSSDWDDPANWSAGIPSSGDTVTIPGIPPNGANFPIYDNGPLIDFTIQSFGGDITFDAVVYNTGAIINSGGGTITSNQVFINAGMVTFNNNDGTFVNNGTADNYGTFNNAGTSTLLNPTGSTFNNYGDIDNFGTITNGGTLVNNGNITSTSTITNDGTITNNGFLDIAFGGSFVNGTGSVLNSTVGSFVDVNTDFLNDGSVIADGSFFIQTASTFTNNGSFAASSAFGLSGDFINNGTLTTSDELSINDSGLLENNNVVTNTGTITLSVCGQIIQNVNNTIAGTILNDGIIYEIGGQVDVTSNMEFGSEFTDLNQRKSPDVKCRSGMLVFLDENGNGSISIDAVDKNSFGFCGATIATRVLSQETFTVADLGVNELTLTITDNFGEFGTCNSFITVIDYFPPVVPVDDPDITFSCPADITVTTLPGGSIQTASWTEPTATTTCTGGNTGNGLPVCAGVPQTIPNFNYVGEFNDSKYYVSTVSTYNYPEAAALAANAGGHLVTISDAAENQYVANNLPAGGSAWLGITDEVVEGTWFWVTGETDTYLNWQSGEPNEGTNANHARIKQDNGQWTDRNALNNDFYVVLEVDCQQGTIPCSAVNQNITGATYIGEFGDSKYFVTNQASTWTAGKTFAENNGGHLAVIESQGENDFIQTNINPASGSVWTGLNNVGTGSTFNWVNGAPVSYTNWQDGEPNGSPDNHGARMKKSTGEWTDRFITDLYEVVFEIPCDNSAPICEDVDLQITFDNYPEDISWVINDSNGNAVASGGNYGNEPNGSTITLTNCLPTGCYDFLLTDSFGDGLCCSNGNGSWSISNTNGTVYGSGAQFTTTQNASFCIIAGGPSGGGGGGNGLTVGQITGGQNGGQFPIGVNEVSYSVTDNCGNSEVCIFTVTVEENPADITVNDCPTDITINTAPGAPTAIATWTAPTATTDCFKPNTNIEQTIGQDSGTEFLIGSHNIAYSITDSCGNFMACSFNVIVQEVVATLSSTSCPGDQDVQIPVGQTSTTVTWVDPTGTSDCYAGNVTANQLVGPSSGSSFSLGQTQIVYVLTDQCGNSELCAFNINVTEACPTAGTTCDDGDASTENDVEDGNCGCAGTPCPTAGTTCDDGDVSTENDVEDGNCGCAGTPCPTVGTTCDDGDASTENDVEDGNCGCAGTPCPIAGTTCDDGDANTENDIEDGNCGCAGTPIVCPPAGTTCDDGDASTENDVEDGNCGCAGTPCPTAGTTCDDGDASTENDVEDGNCGCAGTPCPIAGTTCDDGDANTENDIEDGNCGCAGTPIVCPPVGTTCDDGDASTENDVEDGNCGCAGTPCPIAGTTCDDGDASTENDVENGNCGCAGTPCPIAGTTCDDGDASTENDVEDGNCGCAGTPCPIAGTTCDDGDANTENDIEDGNCGCAGTPIVCPPVGTTCDDGDASTENDVEDGNCGCAGTPCPIAGTTCDDGDASTENDVEDGNCGCAGTPCPTAGTTCNDGDASTENDVEDGNCGCAGTPCPIAGTTCDDGDANTENDIEDGNCGCAGTPIVCPPVGTTCDDGDASTENDVEDGNCGCAGTPCPIAGTTCDDGDASTENDVEDGNCGCAGTPCPTAGTTCNDGDASTENDVEDGNCGCAGTPCPTAGTTCDDGDANTENDIEDGNCGCAGTPIGGGCATTSNLALSPAASADQSSINLGAEASRAIDGNTSGDFFGQNSVSLTNWETNAWWEIDLGVNANIESLNIWNREDCCTQFLANYYIFVSNAPFASNDLNTTLNDPNVTNFLQTDPAGLPSAINLNTTGRYVRIQLIGTSFLGLAEVEVIGCIGGSGCAPAGTICDDGDATTQNDVEDGNCGCVGTPCPTAGTTCDDGNATTENDVADGSCGCAGTPIGGGCATTSNLATASTSTATQSSDNLGAVASRAIDGNTDGNFYGQNSVSLTNWETQAWLEVDLGVVGNIESVNVWNRTDCCSGFLKNYYILVSDVPFVSQDLQATLVQSGVDNYFETATAGTPSTISINRTGRYVRIQLQGTSFLGIAELEIIGCTTGGGCSPAGTTCDDGDANTENDVEDGNCGCAGTPCPIVGTTCDDGDANTENDVEDGNCGCAGTPINCPAVGTACDDGDATTENDVEDGNCGCAGTPCPIVGTTCDDGDASTENDVEDGNCGCAGTPIGNGCTTTTNVALTGTSNQSSTLTAGGITGNSEKAIDGNTNGVYFTANPLLSSVTATNNSTEPFWEVALDANYLIEQIDVYNRTDGNDRSNDVWVLVSSTPFTATDLAGARAEAEWEEFIPGLVGSPSTVLPDMNGQYVRVQMEGSGYLVLAEVEVYGCTTSAPVGLAIPNMLYFDAKKEGIRTNIDWMMAKDVEVDFYEVEVSTDGNNFRLLDDVNALQANSPRHYDALDMNPEFGENFYRLKVNQLDGSHFYSNVRRVNFEIDFDNVIVYPNPTEKMINIALRDFGGKSGTVEIYNQLGQRMTSRVYQSFPTIPAVFDVSEFVNGIYTISIKVDNHKRFTKKFVVTKL